MWPWLGGLLGIVAMVACFVVPMPYYVEGPGSVTATQPLVTITGHGSYRSEGVIMFTTVSERRATPFLLLRAWLDETIDSVPADVAVPSGNRTAERRIEQRAMDQSKLTALSLAFDRLDLPLTITGTGAFIREVLEGFPGSTVLREGDVIERLDGTEIATAADVGPLMAGRKIGDRVSMSLRREGAEAPVDVEVELGRNEDDPSKGYLGITLVTADEDVKLPFDIELDSGSVIGPSAGLAWTLGVLDRLTPGDLAHGRRVAVTGTIGMDGTVGPIGGISQKVKAATDSGATLFLYPASMDADEVRRMRGIAGDDIQLESVATLDEALEVLDPNGLGAGKSESPSD